MSAAKRYRTLEDDDGAEAETALRTAGIESGDSPFVHSGKESTKLTASGSKHSTGTGSHPPYVDPKISGKGWGRIFKFFKGIKEYPRAILFIVGNEFCERFTYYGLRAVLILYLTEHMSYGDNSATALYHAFIMLCYLSPLFGAMIADGFLGKYRTILYLSMVYAVGNLVLAGTSAPLGSLTATQIVPLVGLLLIAFGTGGIKPCVAAFGGDQFTESQSHLLQRYFSIFYFAINAGSVLSTFISPYLRSNTSCFGADCYLYAFGLPAILMIVAIGIFVAGNKYYVKNPLTGNVIAQFFSAVARGIKNRIANRKSLEKKEHWLYWAEDRYERRFLDDIRDALRVVLILIPVPIFWTLFDQTGSRWTLQAKRMDGRLGSAIIEPDQMQVANSIMILIFIPLFESVIYPVLRFCKLPMRPLQRMSTGMLFAGLSFVVAAFVQIRLEDATDAVPPRGTSEFRVINGLPTGLRLNVTQSNGVAAFGQELQYGGATGFGKFSPGEFSVMINTDIAGVPFTLSQNFNVTDRSVMSVVAGYNSNNEVSLFEISHDVSKLGGEEYAVRVLNCNPEFERVWASLYWYDNSKKKGHYFDFGYNASDSSTGITLFGESKRELPSPPARDWLLKINDVGTNRSRYNATYEFFNGGMYTVVLLPANANSSAPLPGEAAQQFVDVSPAGVHILWQIPQYAVLTAGEIMFSITGLEFAYSQSPKSMKSVMQAMWLLTVAIGNLVVVIVAEAEIFHDQVHEFFFFAGMTAVVTFIFILLAIRYTYVEKREVGSDDVRPERYTLLDDQKAVRSPSPGSL